jgi:hypothetical protein
MHDIDRVLFEDPHETYAEEGGAFETYAEEGPFETYAEEGGAFETYAEEGGPLGEALRDETGVFNETALASELLEVSTNEELDRFLGNLVSSAVSAAKDFARSDAGRAVGGILKSAAKRVLPQVGQAVGNYLAPGVGGQWGQSAGKWLGSKLELGLEVEGLSPEDRQFETARAFVRFGRDTARLAARAPLSLAPAVAAQRAAINAAQRNLPGLITVPGGRIRRPRSGRWVRRGGNIIIIGA